MSDPATGTEKPVESPEVESADPSVAAAATQMDIAVDMIAQENFPAALSALNSAIVDADESRLPECYALRGYALLKLRQFDRAEQDCTKAIELRHSDLETYAWRAAARGQLGRWRETYEDLQKAKRESDDPSEYDDLMNQYFEPAMAWFRQRIQQGGLSRIQAFGDRGWINHMMENYEKAKRDFELALQHDPHFGSAMLGLAENCLATGQLEQAVEFAELTLRTDGKWMSRALMCQVRATYQAGRIRDAVAALQRLRQLSNQDPRLLSECAALRFQIHDYVGALEDLNLLIETNPPRSSWYKLRADTNAAINHPALALSDYTRVLRMDPQRAGIWVRRGEMNTALQRFDRALRDFDRAAELGLVNEPLFLGRARALEAQGQFDEAIQQCKKAQRLVPDSAEVFALEGQIYAKQQQYSKALDQLGRAIELTRDDSKKAEYLYLRGNVRYKAEQHSQALADFQAAQRLRPHHAGTMIWTAAASARLEDWAAVIESLHQAIAVRPAAAEQYKALGVPIAGKAVEHFTRQIQRRPKDSDALRNRGMAFQFLGSAEAAVQDFSDSLQIEEDAQTRLRRGQVFFSQAKFAKSVDDFSQAISHLEPDHPLRHLALFWRAKSELSLGRLEAALHDVKSAIDLSPESAAYPVLLAVILRRQGRSAEAIEALTQAIAIDFTDHVPFNLRGQLYLKDRQCLKAIVDFCQSLDLNPKQPAVIAWRGEAYLKHGQSDAALEDFELALTHDPRLVRAYCGRAHVLAERDRHEEATIWLTKAIHRFKDQAEWARLLLSRGKIFYQMSRFLPAIADFSAVLSLKRQDPASRNAARYARALAMVQQGQLILAQKELSILIRDEPEFPGARTALDWLTHGQGPRPPQLHPPQKMIRPKRPPVVRDPIPLPADDPQWHSHPPHDRWILRMRNASRTEYGPIHKRLLDQWVSEGRIAPDTKVLRSDWDKWKRASQIYAELAAANQADARPDSAPNIVL